MNRQVILNTIKISIAAIVSILIAQYLHLEFAISTGIIAILSIQSTKKETIQTAFVRFIAFISALLIAYISFSIFGIGLFGFIVYLVLFLFLCQYCGWYSAMAVNSVLVSHFLVFKDMQLSHILNEVYIFIIGVSSGIVINLHLKKDSYYINILIEQADLKIKNILEAIAMYIISIGQEGSIELLFSELSDVVREAENIAKQNFQNQFGFRDRYDIQYIEMRKRQKQTLIEMFELVKTMKTTPTTAQKISQFLCLIENEYHKENRVLTLLEKFRILDMKMKSVPLPISREEFEDRAKLFILLRKIEKFLKIKYDFMKEQSYSKNKKKDVLQNGKG